jgi:hypothetical protein
VAGVTHSETCAMGDAGGGYAPIGARTHSGGLKAHDRIGDDGMAIVDVTRIAAAIAKQFARKVWDVELIGSTRVYRGRWQRLPQLSPPRTAPGATTPARSRLTGLALASSGSPATIRRFATPTPPRTRASDLRSTRRYSPHQSR